MRKASRISSAYHQPFRAFDPAPTARRIPICRTQVQAVRIAAILMTVHKACRCMYVVVGSKRICRYLKLKLECRMILVFHSSHRDSLCSLGDKRLNIIIAMQKGRPTVKLQDATISMLYQYHEIEY